MGSNLLLPLVVLFFALGWLDSCIRGKTDELERKIGTSTGSLGNYEF